VGYPLYIHNGNTKEERLNKVIEVMSIKTNEKDKNN
jgi:hypothetical protein|tara:strand:+ start:1073 stop:1180 length:108 start_codon:yes stop_codon:yes gene_type:complete